VKQGELAISMEATYGLVRFSAMNLLLARSAASRFTTTKQISSVLQESNLVQAYPSVAVADKVLTAIWTAAPGCLMAEDFLKNRATAVADAHNDRMHHTLPTLLQLKLR
jgi:hypothetical protein